MGCGEGRIQYLVTTLEALPPKSVVLIEEPRLIASPCPACYWELPRGRCN